MAPAPLRVFLSHTSELREFPVDRSFVGEAEKAITDSGDAIVNMEYFPVADELPAAVCVEQKVLEADVYVGIIGLRYGSPVRDQQQLSYTELEFETATEGKRRRLIFFLDENAALPIPPGGSATTTRSIKRVNVGSATISGRRPGSPPARWPHLRSCATSSTRRRRTFAAKPTSGLPPV